MTIIDFKQTHISEAAELALSTYNNERISSANLPPIESVPNITNKLGVAAFDNGKMVGFLCVYPPFDNAFGSTDVRGVFSPMGANAAISAKVYVAMYQFAAEKWVKAGAVSHAVCLYAHDDTANQQFYRYGFGIRCMDAVRRIELIDCSPCNGYEFSESSSIAQLNFKLHEHQLTSPYFLNRKFNPTLSGRYFIATYNGKICAYLNITPDGETFISDRTDYTHISGAYCLPEHRGNGVYQNLLNYAISILKQEGFNYLGVDFESFNPAAYGFWTKYFTVYTHGVVRRIDEHILEVIK
jgi:Acetyltransferase (GNAT) family.